MNSNKIQLSPFKFSGFDTTEDLVLYRYYNGNKLLYIGITKDIHSRTHSHSKDSHWFRQATHSTFQRGFATRGELERAEIMAIQTERPKYNIAYNI